MRLLCSLVLWLICHPLGHCQDLVINEFLASNNTCCTDEFGEADDWVELYNAGSQPIDLAGLWFSDQAGVSGWQIPDDDDEITTVAPGGFIVVWFDEQMEQGLLHVDDKLSAGGESIVVYLEDGVTELLHLDFGPQTSDVSQGFSGDGEGDWISFESPTPGASNLVTALGQRGLRPGSLSLGASPNPFTPRTRVSYALDQRARVTLQVFDLLGHCVARLDQGPRAAGHHSLDWTPAPGLASGSYLLILDSDHGQEIARILYLK